MAGYVKHWKVQNFFTPILFWCMTNEIFFDQPLSKAASAHAGRRVFLKKLKKKKKYIYIYTYIKKRIYISFSKYASRYVILSLKLKTVT